MGLQDREERALAEIEQRLAEDDPRFAARLDHTRSWHRIPRPVLLGAALVATYVVGLLAVIAGVTLSSVPLIALGAVVITAFPAAVAARAWRAHRRP
ncbi:hypothetical protein ADK67_12125 [Saccharothrix sp. NRRL B-16348]|jgi:hypothetical protein|uniref:DUF3040 domain-containing protein n=1 Tax=Saccharothrix sp. NRRL B-16348 TaxID=1415542 RepID=UPI0006AEBA48|nr:DUF3040 domain-containing protein [Saccharothrix sp. NRRL B-16348]KOX28180.1 hypothetical protein ADK67_12125 [Saccharothrix sp. NRRL B-16348]